MAYQIFKKKSIEEVSQEDRNKAKQTCLGTLYGKIHQTFIYDICTYILKLVYMHKNGIDTSKIYIYI
jgi:hypothetical protein